MSARTPLDLAGVVETALAEALMLAARAGRWEIVEQIATELRARRSNRDDDAPRTAIPPANVRLKA